MGGMHPGDFATRLKEINTFIHYFPVEELKTIHDLPNPLQEDELVDIMDNAKPPQWAARILEAQVRPHLFKTVDAARDYFVNLYNADLLRTRFNKIKRDEGRGTKRSRTYSGNTTGVNDLKPKGHNNGRPRKRAKFNKPKGNNNKEVPTCSTCGTRHRGACWHKEENKALRPSWCNSIYNKGSTNKTNSSNKQSILAVVKRTTMNKLVKKAAKNSKKRRVIEDSDDDSLADFREGNYNLNMREQGSDTESNHKSFSDRLRKSTSSKLANKETLFPFHLPPTKKSKQGHLCAEVIVETTNRQGDKVPIRALLDTGTTSTIILKEFVQRGRASSYKGKKQEWTTIGGTFSTRSKALIDMTLPELDKSKTITWICHVDDKTPAAKAAYDIIIGMDLMTEIGIVVNTANKTIDWEGQSIPLKHRGLLSEPTILEAYY